MIVFSCQQYSFTFHFPDFLLGVKLFLKAAQLVKKYPVFFFEKLVTIFTGDSQLVMSWITGAHILISCSLMILLFSCAPCAFQLVLSCRLSTHCLYT